MPAKDPSVTESPPLEADSLDLDGAGPDAVDIDALEAEGSHEGLGHRSAKHPSDREHGVKTRIRSKQINSGRPYAS